MIKTKNKKTTTTRHSGLTIIKTIIYYPV